MILTPRTVKYVRKSVELGAFFCFHPLTWNRAKGHTELGSFKRQVVWYLNVVFSLAYAGFVAVRCAQVTTSPTAGYAEKIPMWAITVLLINTPTCAWSLFIYKEEFATFGRQYLGFNGYLLETESVITGKKTLKLAQITEVLVVGSYYCFLSVYFLWVLAAILHPSSPHLISSLGFTSPVGILVSSLLWAHYFFTFCSGGILFAGFMFSCVGSTVEILRLPSPNLNVAVSVYRVVQMLTQDCNQIFSGIITSVKFTVVISSVYGTFVAIRSSGPVAAAMGLTTFNNLGIIITLMSGLAMLHDSSSDLLLDMKYALGQAGRETGKCTLEKRRLRKCLRCLRPVHFSILGMYPVRKVTVLGIIEIVADNLISMLVAF